MLHPPGAPSRNVEGKMDLRSIAMHNGGGGVGDGGDGGGGDGGGEDDRYERRGRRGDANDEEDDDNEQVGRMNGEEVGAEVGADA